MAIIITFPAPVDEEAARLAMYLDGSPVDETSGKLGTPEDWAWTAVSYLKTALDGTQGGALGGAALVSAAAVGVLLGYVEDLAAQAGVIPAPGGAA